MPLRLCADRIKNSSRCYCGGHNSRSEGVAKTVASAYPQCTKYLEGANRRGDLLTDKNWKNTSCSHSFSYFQTLKHSKPVCDTQELCPAARHALGLWLQLQTLPQSCLATGSKDQLIFSTLPSDFLNSLIDRHTDIYSRHKYGFGLVDSKSSFAGLYAFSLGGCCRTGFQKHLENVMTSLAASSESGKI